MGKIVRLSFPNLTYINPLVTKSSSRQKPISILVRMRVSVIILLATLSYTNGNLRKNYRERELARTKDKRSKREFIVSKFSEKVTSLKNTKPSEVGQIHNAAFETLGDLYSEEKPSTTVEVMSDLSGIISSLCPAGDILCDAMTYKAVLQEYHTANNKENQINFPKEFDERLKDSILMAETTVMSLDDRDHVEVEAMLSVLQDDVQQLENVKPDEQALTIASLSVAEESTKLWYDVYTNPENSLHGIVANKIEHRRRMQEDEEDTIVSISIEGRLWSGIFELVRGSILADFYGTIKGGLSVLSSIPSNPVLIWPWYWPSSVASVALFHAIPASAKFVFGTNDTALLEMKQNKTSLN